MDLTSKYTRQFSIGTQTDEKTSQGFTSERCLFFLFLFFLVLFLWFPSKEEATKKKDHRF